MTSAARKTDPIPVLYGLEDIADRTLTGRAAKHSAVAADKVNSAELRRAVAERYDLQPGQSVKVACSTGPPVVVSYWHKYRNPTADHRPAIDALPVAVRARMLNEREMVSTDIASLRHALRAFPGAADALLEASGVTVKATTTLRPEAAEVALELERTGHPQAIAALSMLTDLAYAWQVSPGKSRK